MDKYGFVYLWYNKVSKMYYIGSHWGTEDDGYICSSNWMRNTHKRHPEDFAARKIISRIYTNRADTFVEEERYLQMIKDTEIKPNTKTPRYYNLTRVVRHWAASESKMKEIFSVKTNSQRSETLKKKHADDDIIPSMLGKQHSEEWKIAQSERVKQQWKDGIRNKEQFKNSGDKFRGIPLSEDHKAKLSQSHMGKTPSNIIQLQSPECREKARIAKIGYKATDVTKEKMRESQRKRREQEKNG